MSAKTRDMRLTAFRSIHSDGIEMTLEDILRRIADVLPNHEDRVHQAASRDESAIISSIQTHPNNSGVGVVVSTFEAGSEISALDFNASKSDVKLELQEAGEGKEFLAKNISLYIAGNSVVGCGVGGRATYVGAVLHQIAQRAKAIPDSETFNLAALPSVDTLQRVRKTGVKQIKLNAAVLLGAARDAIGVGIFDAVFAATDSAEQLKRKRENIATLSISTAKNYLPRIVSGVEVGEQDKNKWLDSVATEVVEEGEVQDYEIILNDDAKIKSGSLLMVKKVKILREGSSYDLNDALQKMKEFYISDVANR